MAKPSALSDKQIHRRVECIKATADETRISTSWLAFMRKALGMSSKVLSIRVKQSVASIRQAEMNEVAGTITLNRLRAIAEAMECELVYAIVPTKKIAQVKSQAAEIKAKRLLKSAGVHMALEDQEVKSDLAERIALLKNELLQKGDIW